MIKKLAIAFGIVFILIGILGFVPGATQNEHLLGIFHVNPAHNFVHLLTGGAALVAGLTSMNAAQLFFRVFGVIYALVAVLGFMAGDAPILGIISNNVADAWSTSPRFSNWTSRPSVLSYRIPASRAIRRWTRRMGGFTSTTAGCSPSTEKSAKP